MRTACAAATAGLKTRVSRPAGVPCALGSPPERASPRHCQAQATARRGPTGLSPSASSASHCALAGAGGLRFATLPLQLSASREAASGASQTALASLVWRRHQRARVIASGSPHIRPQSYRAGEVLLGREAGLIPGLRRPASCMCSRTPAALIRAAQGSSHIPAAITSEYWIRARHPIGACQQRKGTSADRWAGGVRCETLLLVLLVLWT